MWVYKLTSFTQPPLPPRPGGKGGRSQRGARQESVEHTHPRTSPPPGRWSLDLKKTAHLLHYRFCRCRSMKGSEPPASFPLENNLKRVCCGSTAPPPLRVSESYPRASSRNRKAKKSLDGNPKILLFPDCAAMSAESRN